MLALPVEFGALLGPCDNGRRRIGFDAPGLPPHAASAHITAKTITVLRFLLGDRPDWADFG